MRTISPTEYDITADARLDKRRLPRHIAIIMDGNGRWAQARGKHRVEGHEAGARSVRAVIEGCRELGIPALSLYAFSTENWKRSKLEVNALFRLLSKYIQQEIDELDANNVRVRMIGDKAGLPQRTLRDLEYCLERTHENTALHLNIAINYGGRAEIVDATRRIAADLHAGRIAEGEITESLFARYLYNPEWPEVDLLIRTSGEMRVSNFMLWQISYAEIVVPETLWPDFGKEALCDAILSYQQRDRRFGGRT
ncbi:MAG: isoprenyl transferase [Candidatus Hydrogenedentes bacterium]|nr:isoprenyl transferase [Candidatus Hydrogenedentota bacterium]